MRRHSHPDSHERAQAAHRDEQLAAHRAAVAQGRVLLAELGGLVGGGSAYLAKETASGALCVGLLEPRAEFPGEYDFSVVQELEPSIPGPSTTCTTCGRPVGGWARICSCGADVSGIVPTSNDSREALIAQVREAAAGQFEVLGSIPYNGNGGPAYFARVAETGEIVALHLHERESFPGGMKRYSLAASEPLLPLESEDATSPHSGPVRFTAADSIRVAPDRGDTPNGGARPTDEGINSGRLPWGLSGLGSGLLAKQPTPRPEEAVAVPRICPLCGTEYETGLRFCPTDGSPLRPKGSTDPLVGRVVADRYHVLKRLGEGGMGRVYLAEHVKMNRQCAIKVMSASMVNDGDSATRFAREASNAARIIHPNVAAVFDYGESDGLVYIVMEYVDGEALSRVIEREHVLAPERALDIVCQVADGLSAAHELGIVHRDLKPDNIIVARGRNGKDVAKVVDFGIAKAMQEGPGEALTRTGLVIGTPEYMSPEQLLGDPVDASSDVYSLGCILYQLLAGTQAFDAPTRELMIKRRLTEDPPRIRTLVPQLPQPLDHVVQKMLARSPSDRYATGAHVRDALEPATVLTEAWNPDNRPTPRSATTEPIVLAATQKLRAHRSPRRTVRVVAAGTGLGVIALVGGAALVKNARPPSRPASAAAALSGRRLQNGKSVAATASPKPPSINHESTLAKAKGPTPAGALRDSAHPKRSAALEKPVVKVSPAIAALRRPIDRYLKAVESKNVSRVRTAFPRISREQLDNWDRNFRIADRITAVATYGNSTVTGDSATVDFAMLLRYTQRNNTQRAQNTVNYVATVLRGPGKQWVLQDMKAVDAR